MLGGNHSVTEFGELDDYVEFDMVILPIGWHPDASTFLVNHAKVGPSEARAAGSVFAFVQEIANRKWSLLDSVDVQLTPGKQFRHFTLANLTTIVQVLNPVVLRVVAVGVVSQDYSFNQLVSDAFSRV